MSLNSASSQRLSYGEMNPFDLHALRQQNPNYNNFYNSRRMNYPPNDLRANLASPPPSDYVMGGRGQRFFPVNGGGGVRSNRSSYPRRISVTAESSPVFMNRNNDDMSGNRRPISSMANYGMFNNGVQNNQNMLPIPLSSLNRKESSMRSASSGSSVHSESTASIGTTETSEVASRESFDQQQYATITRRRQESVDSPRSDGVSRNAVKNPDINQKTPLSKRRNSTSVNNMNESRRSMSVLL